MKHVHVSVSLSVPKALCPLRRGKHSSCTNTNMLICAEGIERLTLISSLLTEPREGGALQLEVSDGRVTEHGLHLLHPSVSHGHSGDGGEPDSQQQSMMGRPVLRQLLDCDMRKHMNLQFGGMMKFENNKCK